MAFRGTLCTSEMVSKLIKRLYLLSYPLGPFPSHPNWSYLSSRNPRWGLFASLVRRLREYICFGICVIGHSRLAVRVVAFGFERRVDLKVPKLQHWLNILWFFYFICVGTFHRKSRFTPYRANIKRCTSNLEEDDLKNYELDISFSRNIETSRIRIQF